MDIIKRIIIILFVFILVGCASIRTTIENPQGEIFTIISKKDALVTYKQNKVEITVDNRGKLGLFENLLGIIVMKTDVELKNKEGD